MRLHVLSVAIAIVVSTSIAQSQEAQRKPSAAISDVKTSPPVVVATTPRAGDTEVDPATTEITVTFSKPMQDGNWAFVKTSKETYPETTGKPRYLDDQRTCALPVKLEAGKSYVIWINKAPYDSFSDPDGRKALPYVLVFETAKK